MNARVKVLATVPTREARFAGSIELWRLDGLEVGKLPAWFRRIVDRDFNGHLSADWFDHFAKDGGALVVEPYNLDLESTQDLIQFAEKYGLRLSISAMSQHYPTRTLSISLTPREEKAQ
jgi:hypothetical protein